MDARGYLGTKLPSLYARIYLPQDTTIGAAFIETEVTDTTMVTTAYDGTSLAYFSTADREVSLNDFSTWKLPFRPVSPPFMSYCLSILKYVLQEEQSVQSALTEEAENVAFETGY